MSADVRHPAAYLSEYSDDLSPDHDHDGEGLGFVLWFVAILALLAVVTL